MKPALRWIPIEVWVDVFRFAWIARWELGEIVDQIGNRKFAEYLQFYLHDWGKRTLKTVHLSKIMALTFRGDEMLPGIPQTPMPNNIRFFERILIGHFDSGALDFLRRINSLFISNDVNLCFDPPYRYGYGYEPRKDLPNLRTALDHLAPMLNGIQSISIDECLTPLVEQCFTAKLAQIKMLTIDFGLGPTDQVGRTDQAAIQTRINFCMNWLTSGQQEFSDPKILVIKVIAYHLSEMVQQFSKAQFLTAKSACTFAIHFEAGGTISHIADFKLENSLGEQLHGQFNFDMNAGPFRINRHRPNARKALQEWAEGIVGNVDKSSVIDFSHHLTIGPIDANTLGSGVNNAIEAGGDQPSTSNK